MRPYLYTVIAYFVLMFIAKVTFTLYGLEKKEKKAIRPSWNLNVIQLREAVMSYLF